MRNVFPAPSQTKMNHHQFTISTRERPFVRSPEKLAPVYQREIGTNKYSRAKNRSLHNNYFNLRAFARRRRRTGGTCERALTRRMQIASQTLRGK